MKRTSFFYFSLAAIAASSFASCQDYDPMNENELLAIQAQKQYEAAAKEFAQNFITRFGEPDPNHTWGFGPLNASSSASQTRADGAGNVYVNRNQWAQKQSDGSFIVEAIADDVNIPGWPNDDNYYYYSIDDHYVDGISSSWPNNNNSRPVGDVTEYEIQYVSAWFRTHKIENPEDYRLNLHLSDFFIQNVSADNDQWSYNSLTSSDQTGVNGDNINVVSTADLADGKHPNIKLNSSTPQGVQFNLDHLCFKPIGANDQVDGTWTHVNDFNAGTSNHDPENNPYHNPYRTIQYITSSGTEDFACHPSLSSSAGTDYLKDWVLVRLTWQEKMADGNIHQREGYYLAFDFAASKDEIEIGGDDYYSNWIVKITPGRFSPLADTRRIMCEDLGNTFDFDFNDVVFDVRFEQVGYSGNYEAVISLRAAGGTLPIFVGNNPDVASGAYEAHRMLGDYSNPKQPINAKDGGIVRGESIYRVATGTSTDPDEITIYVKYGDNDVRTVAKAHRGNLEEVDGGYKPGPYNPQNPLTSTTVPQKVAVSTSTYWMKELQFIEKSYKYFPDWVKSDSFRVPGLAEGQNNWYNVHQEDGLLYKWTAVAEPGQPTGSSVWNGNYSTNSITPYSGKSFDGASGVLKIAGYEGADPIYKQLEDNPSLSKIVFTIVYDNCSAPFTGKLAPRNEDGTTFTGSSGKSFEANVAATKQMAAGRFSHRFTFTKEDLVNGENICEYLVLYSSGITPTYWFCTYE